MAQTAPAPPSAASSPDPKRDEARMHFEQGLAHFDRDEWSAALAEFLQSRALFPTRAATKDAAICLRKERRFDESLDMYEALLREFPDLSQDDRALAVREIDELRSSIGGVDLRVTEPGASIVVDGRDRGTTPLHAPLRVGAGSHVIRVYKDGFLPFERQIDVAGRRLTRVDVRLQAYGQAGRLRVNEEQGRALDLVVDGVVIGKTPWEGSLPVGSHSVVLRGAGALGTQPALVPVRINDLTPITLQAEELQSEARIEPTPLGATVAIDGVVVGSGVWEGRLRAGSHKVEVAADGFLASTRALVLARNAHAKLAVELERDSSSTLWSSRRARFAIEIDAALAIGAHVGGDAIDGCTAPCTAPLPLGARGVLHAGYELTSGLGLGVDVGYLTFLAEANGRSAQLLPLGRAVNQGTLNDHIRASSLTLGGAIFFHHGEAWPVLLRLGLGVALASLGDARTGTFTNSAGESYAVDVKETPSTTFLYAAPELRLGRRLGEHFEISLGVEAMLLAATKVPRWTDASPVLTAPPSGAARGDGFARFGSSSLTSAIVVVVTPGVGLTYSF